MTVHLNGDVRMKHQTEVILDLTKPLDCSLEIYVEHDYRDPDFSCVEWCSIEEQGYRVSALSLGTQTGTHIDAPAHFDSSGPCLEALSLDNLMGRYFLMDLPRNIDHDHVKMLCHAYGDEPILFVRADSSGLTTITQRALEELLNLPPVVWAVSGTMQVAAADSLEFHRVLARSGKFLIENLHAELVNEVRAGGELFALPLKLVGTSGSPCRVAVRQSR